MADGRGPGREVRGYEGSNRYLFRAPELISQAAKSLRVSDALAKLVESGVESSMQKLAWALSFAAPRGANRVGLLFMLWR